MDIKLFAINTYDKIS